MTYTITENYIEHPLNNNLRRGISFINQLSINLINSTFTSIITFLIIILLRKKNLIWAGTLGIQWQLIMLELIKKQYF